MTMHRLPAGDGSTSGVVALHGRSDTIVVAPGWSVELSLDSIGFGRLNVAWRTITPPVAAPLVPNPDVAGAIEGLLQGMCPRDREVVRGLFLDGLEVMSSTSAFMAAANNAGIRPRVDG